MHPIRDILNQELQRRKSKNASYSLRAFSKYLDMSPAQVSQILSGKRSISLKVINKISRKLSLSPIELHKLTQEISGSFDNDLKKIKLSDDKFNLIAHWSHLALLSLGQLDRQSSDPRILSQELGLTIKEINEALARLSRLKLIETKPYLKQVSPIFEVSSDVPSPAIQKYHKGLLELASLKIDEVQLEKREFQNLSMAINEKALPEFKKFIQDFYSGLEKLGKKHKGPLIYNFSLQMFPLNKRGSK